MDDSMVGMLMIGLFAVMIMMCMRGSPPPKKFDEKAQREIAQRALAGEKPEEIAKKEGCTVEDINKWKDDYVKMSVKYANDAPERSIAEARKDEEIRWYQETLRKDHGENWREKTGFYDRELLRYKDGSEPPKK